MNQKENLKQFRASLFSTELIITSICNDNQAFVGTFNVKHEIKIGWHDWIETEENALSYYECCGIMILFGIEPPTYKQLSSLLGLTN